MNGSGKPFANLLASVWRFARIGISYGIVYGLNAVTGVLPTTGIGVLGVPLVSAALNAVSKFIRQKWGIDVKIV